MTRSKTTELSGWGRYPRRDLRTVRPENIGAIELPKGSDFIGRGQGRSYGDAAICTADGCAILTERLNRYLSFDENTGVLRAEAGTTIAEVLETFVPRGWFPRVAPGTKFVSLGGCVAADVHGKNHHRVGSFGAHTTQVDLTLADGTSMSCSPDEEAELFYATLGGMGLTGLITAVSFRLLPIETAQMMARAQPTRDLEESWRLLAEPANEEYVTSWIDGTATGARLGRGVVTWGRHARRNELKPTDGDPLRYERARSLTVPFSLLSWAFNGFTGDAFNRFYSWHHAGRADPSLTDLESILFPLDAIANWNVVYGRRGFVQYQCVVPAADAPTAVRLLLEARAASGLPSYLGVLKRLGREGAGLLSFPLEGYTLSLDLAMGGSPVFDLLRKFDAIVLRYGGRVYLAKDACLDAETFRAMYARYPEWQRIKARVDPNNRLRSALSERTGLTP